MSFTKPRATRTCNPVHGRGTAAAAACCCLLLPAEPAACAAAGPDAPFEHQHKLSKLRQLFNKPKPAIPGRQPYQAELEEAGVKGGLDAARELRLRVRPPPQMALGCLLSLQHAQNCAAIYTDVMPPSQRSTWHVCRHVSGEPPRVLPQQHPDQRDGTGYHSRPVLQPDDAPRGVCRNAAL
jgi:hypothetical protein